MDVQQPGQVIIPHDDDKKADQQMTNSSNSTQPQQPTAPSSQPAPSPVPATNPTASAQSLPPSSDGSTPAAEKAPLRTEQPTDLMGQDNVVDDAGWQYDDQPHDAGSLGNLNWTATEFIEHAKSLEWYVLLAIAAVVIAGTDYWLTRDLISVGIIVFAILLLGVYAGHKPHTLQYFLSPQGLQIGSKFYSFQEYKAFSVADEINQSSIVFAPLGRFTPPLTIYVAPDVEEAVLDYLSNFLPFEEHKDDAVDSLMRRIHF
ncbi:MAG TPA: hypothetical protein VMB52_01685 [Verrucomicrobiae bacterium]|nr:hypothetical protein [Verrucomicrobiae bacterium]